jgi:hypothetical protein
MRTRITLSLFAFVALAASFASAQIVIDDFTVGAYQSPGYKSGAHGSTQNGNPAHIIGGNRQAGLLMCAPADCPVQNPFNQSASYAFKRKSNLGHALVLSAGYGTGPRIDLYYGYGSPMSVNLSSADRIRIRYLGLTGESNMGMLLYTTTSSYGENACNLPPFPGAFTVELPFSGFVGTGFDPANVNFIRLWSQEGTVIGSTEFAFVSIEAVNGHEAGAIVCHLR